ncbi:MAG: DUF4249 family protein [Bacteroidota bacterium]
MMQQSNRRSWYFLLFVSTLLGVWSCEEEFLPEVSSDPEEIVVEGYIEAGEQATPPFVILTRSIGFFSEIRADLLDELYVHDALVTISDGEQTVELTEVCLDELTDEQKQLVSGAFGLNPDSLGFNFCVYLDLSFSLRGEVGRTYALEVMAEERRLSASTTIPSHVGLQELRFEQPPGEPSDTLRQLICVIDDPAATADFYRYFTGLNGGPTLAGAQSVTDDAFFNGKSFEFPLAKAEPRNAEFDPITFGLFEVGDTAT